MYACVRLCFHQWMCLAVNICSSITHTHTHCLFPFSAALGTHILTISPSGEVAINSTQPTLSVSLAARFPYVQTTTCSSTGVVDQDLHMVHRIYDRERPLQYVCGGGGGMGWGWMRYVGIELDLTGWVGMALSCLFYTYHNDR